MIGGIDVSIDVEVNSFTGSKLIDKIKEIWPDALIEELEHEDITEIFAYKSKEANISWNVLGWNEEFANDMIFITIGKDYITFVCETVEGVVDVLIKSVQDQSNK